MLSRVMALPFTIRKVGGLTDLTDSIRLHGREPSFTKFEAAPTSSGTSTVSRVFDLILTDMQWLYVSLQKIDTTLCKPSLYCATSA